MIETSRALTRRGLIAGSGAAAVVAALPFASASEAAPIWVSPDGKYKLYSFDDKSVIEKRGFDLPVWESADRRFGVYTFKEREIWCLDMTLGICKEAWTRLL